jgi:phosphatidylinositol kinase/protein kinase (PI-3  family)
MWYNKQFLFVLDIKDSLEKKRSIFVNKAIPKHPPVFRNWYLKEFPSPGEWLENFF